METSLRISLGSKHPLLFLTTLQLNRHTLIIKDDSLRIVYGAVGGIARCAVMRSGSNLMGNAINCNLVQFGGGRWIASIEDGSAAGIPSPSFKIKIKSFPIKMTVERGVSSRGRKQGTRNALPKVSTLDLRQLN